MRDLRRNIRAERSDWSNTWRSCSQWEKVMVFDFRVIALFLDTPQKRRIAAREASSFALHLRLEKNLHISTPRQICLQGGKGGKKIFDIYIR